MALPVIIFGFIAGVLAINSLCKRNFADYKVKVISSTLVLFYLMHPSIARVYFMPFNCINVNNESRLRQDLSLLCFTGQHMVEIIVLAFPGIIIWIFGIPAISFLHLTRNKDKIESIQQSG